MQDDVKIFQAWQDFIEHPYNKEEQVLAQRVWLQLFDQGLIATDAHSVLTAPEKEREVYTVQALREVAEKHPAAFRAVWKNVLTTNNDITPSLETVINHIRRSWFASQRKKASQPPMGCKDAAGASLN